MRSDYIDASSRVQLLAASVMSFGLAAGVIMIAIFDGGTW